MTKEQLAAKLNGREYREEITKEEEALAKKHGLVVVFGYSDDNIEFRGAIDDEQGAYEGTTCYVNSKGLLPHHDDHGCECVYCGAVEAKKNAHKLEALWCAAGVDYSWTYETDIPHATFDIMEDGEKFCRGIVFELPKV